MGIVDDGAGKKLHEARTRRKLSLQQVEESTKIRARYLQAIENEDWDQLPGDTYARAFIRTYGALLGLDGDRLAEEQRRQLQAARPGERLPRVDPRPWRAPRRRGQRQVSPQLAGALASALVLGALLVIGLSTGGDSSDSGSAPGPRVDDARAAPTGEPRRQRSRHSGHSLLIEAEGEVWVCLLDGRGAALVDGLILEPGETEGPFRSGSFTLALGNGAVTMTVDGRQADLPKPSSPIGFEVDPRGSVRELPEGERPTCT
jgi:transcriptional regulator with XRE-family HTH domain